MDTATYWITKLTLKPHPEGGYYQETYRSELQVQRPGSAELKQACTSIYYLLAGADHSGFHRLQSDELWYFHKGEPLLIHAITNDGNYSCYELSDEATGSLSIPIKAGIWFAAEVALKTGFTLVSCAVAPGFEFAEFEMAKKAELIILYPQHRDILEKFCRE